VLNLSRSLLVSTLVVFTLGAGPGFAQSVPPIPTQPSSSPQPAVILPARAPEQPSYSCLPVNPEATPEARALLKRICDASGKGILAGQHNFPNQRHLDTDRVHELTGKYPAIWGSDFGFTGGEDKDSILHRHQMIEEAKRQAAAGSLIYLCWHMVRPTEDEPVQPGIGWRESVQAHLTDEQWTELVTSDTPLHKRWEHYVDTAAEYLQQLQEAHIPVLWRPMHENNGNFFWWGGRPGAHGTQQLYREMYARLTYVHHLNNLIWVWNQNAPGPFPQQFFDYFPGRQYVDIVSYDNYGPLRDVYYDALLTIADGKPIALGEVGHPPSAEVLKNQPKWAWFMVWAGMVNDGIKEAYVNPFVLSRGDSEPPPTASAH
jgi:Glycosyl hydrolase family 26